MTPFVSFINFLSVALRLITERLVIFECVWWWLMSVCFPGLTPPTTPPHKPVEDELFKPDGKAELTSKSSCLARAHIRKLPEQTELYAQLRRMGQTGNTDSKSGAQWAYGDHDYCLLGQGENCMTTAAVALGSQCRVEVLEEEEMAVSDEEMEGQEERLLTNCQQRTEADWPVALSSHSPEQTSQPSPVRSPTPEPDAQSPVSCSPPSPGCKLPFRYWTLLWFFHPCVLLNSEILNFWFWKVPPIGCHLNLEAQMYGF